MTRPSSLLSVLTTAIALCCHFITVHAACEEGFQELPLRLQWVKEDLIKLGEENQDNWGSDKTQERVEAYATQLEDWYVHNRPLNEVELEQSAWRLVWFWPYPPFDFNTTNFGFALDRSAS